MRMADWLAQAPLAMQERIAAHPVYQEEVQAGSSLLECLTDEEVLQRSYASLTVVEQEALAGICRKFGLNRIQWRDLDSLPTHRANAEWRAAVASLCEKGLLCIWQKSWGEPTFSLAAEAFPMWSRQFIGAHMERAVEWSPLEMTDAAGEQCCLLVNLLLLARFVESDQLTRSKQGGWHKKPCKKFEQQLRLTASSNLTFAIDEFTIHEHADCLSPGAAAVLDVASRLKLLHWSENRLRLHSSAWSQLLELTGTALSQHISRQWLLWHASDSVWQQHAGFALLAMPDSGWYDLKEMYESLRIGDGLPADVDWNCFADSLTRRLLGPMAAFGWLHVATLQDGRIVVRKSRLLVSRAEDEMDMPYVSAHGEVMLSLTNKLAQHWELLCCAETYAYSEAVHTYRLTRESVWQGMAQGKAASSVLNGMRGEIPDTLLEQLRDWESRYGEIEVSTRLVIRCRNTSVAEQLLQRESIRPIAEAVGDGVLILEANASQSELRKLLAASGYQAAWIEHTDDQRKQVVPADPQYSMIQGYEEQQLSVPATKLPDITDLYDRMSAIPSSWLHEFRQYHPSTGRQLIEQAIRYRSGVQLRVQGDAIRFHPERVIGDRTGWRVEGWVAANRQEREIKQYSPKDWEEIQLLLPGINDNNEVLRS